MAISNEDKKQRDRRIRNSQKAHDRKIDGLLNRGTPRDVPAAGPGVQDPQEANEKLHNELRNGPVGALKPKVAARAKTSKHASK